MYIRTKIFKDKDGSTRTYLQLVDAKRINGKVRQKVVATLGRLEELQENKIDRLIENLAKFSHSQWIQTQTQAQQLGAKWSKEMGSEVVFRALWNHL